MMMMVYLGTNGTISEVWLLGCLCFMVQSALSIVVEVNSEMCVRSFG